VLCEPDQVLHNFRNQALVAVAYHRSHASQPGNLARRPLCVASSYHDLRAGVDALGFTNESASIAISFCGHAAGVHDNYIGLCQRTFHETARAQPDADCFAIGASSAASEILHVEAGHLLKDSNVPITTGILLRQFLNINST
jgi:hypothetical protein